MTAIRALAAPAGAAVASTTSRAPSSGATGAAATGLPADTLKALQAALAAENAAVWAYGLVAAFDPADGTEIATVEAAHLARRDATASLIAGSGGTAAAQAPAYTLPANPKDQPTARALIKTIETDCAAAWRAVIGNTDNTILRGTALAGLSDSAVWLTTFEIAANNPAPTVPFPGQS